MNKTINFEGDDIYKLSSLSYLENINNLENKDLDKSWLRIIITNILKNRFSNILKQSIEEYFDRFTIACPYCGDSEADSSKKRGNIYFNSVTYHCYNCGKHTSVYNFIKKYGDNLKDEELLFLKFKKDIFSHNESQEYLNSDIISKYVLNKKDVMEAFGYTNINNSSVAKTYLKNRYQNKFNNFAYDSKSNAIIIFNEDGKKNILGYTKRFLNKKIKNKYISYKLSRIYNEMGKNIDNIENELNYTDKFSMLFNILQVNFSDCITVFEGPFDANLFNNSVATSGINKNFPLESEYLRYWFDNDDIGIRKSKEFILDGKKVFLWRKYLDDMKIPSYKKIKDLNDLVIFCKNYNLKFKNFKNYFSDSKIDLFFL